MPQGMTPPDTGSAGSRNKLSVRIQEALRNDPEKLQELQADPEVSSIVLGHDHAKLQDFLRTVYKVCMHAPPCCPAPRPAWPPTPPAMDWCMVQRALKACHHHAD